MIGILLVLSAGCAPDAPVSNVRSDAAGAAANLGSLPLRLSADAGPPRVGTEFIVRIVDDAFEQARRRRFPVTAVRWESSRPNIASLVVDPTNPGQVRVTFRSADSATVTVGWSDRTGSWRGVGVSSATDTTSQGGSFRPLPADNPAELPRDSVVPPSVEGGGAVRRVRAGQSIQAAIDASAYGDVILLEPGARFMGPVILRRKSGRGWITIRTDATPTAVGQRVTLADTARFARIETPATGNASALVTEAQAAGYRLVNIDIAQSPNTARLNALVALGDGGSAQNTITSVPSRLVLDRVIVRGRASLTLRRCISLQSAHTAIINSIVIECHEKGADSQAIAGWNGPGPFLIRNNLLEGAGENIMFGGADPSIAGLNPSDIIVEHNHVRKPDAWFRSGDWTVKNLFELKTGRRVLVRGNLFENNWPDGQSGVAILLKSVNQDGRAPWSETSDITFVENVIRHSSAAISLAARPEQHPAVPMSRLLIARNVMYRLGGESGFPAGTQRALLVQGGVAHLHIDENTMSSPASVINVVRDGDPPRVPGFAFRRNASRFGSFGIHGGGTGLASFQSSYTTVDFAENCIFGAPSASLAGYAPGALLTVASTAQTLPGLDSGDFSLAANSACHRVSSTTVPGVSATDLQRRLQQALAGR